MRFLCGLAFVVAVLVSTTAQAPYTKGVVKIGVLTDMSGHQMRLGSNDDRGPFARRHRLVSDEQVVQAAGA